MSGAVAAMNNYIFLMSGQVGIGPGIAVVLFLLMVAVALQIGEVMDSPQENGFKISDERWAELKLELGYPEV